MPGHKRFSSFLYSGRSVFPWSVDNASSVAYQVEIAGWQEEITNLNQEIPTLAALLKKYVEQVRNLQNQIATITKNSGLSIPTLPDECEAFPAVDSTSETPACPAN